MWKRRMRRLRRKDLCGSFWVSECGGRREGTDFDDLFGADEVRARTDNDAVGVGGLGEGEGGEGGFEEGEVGEVGRSVRVDEEDARAGGMQDALLYR